MVTVPLIHTNNWKKGESNKNFRDETPSSSLSFDDSFPFEIVRKICERRWCDFSDQMPNSDQRQIRTEEKFGPKI